MSASEYGFQIENPDPDTTYFELSTPQVAKEFVEVAEHILEEHYGFDSPYTVRENPPRIEVRSEDPAPFLALKEARETLQSVENLEDAYDLLDDGL